MIGTRFGNDHSWVKYRLIQNSFKIGSPEVKTHYIDIPGRTDGPLDATESTTGKVLYGLRRLEINFEIPGWFDPKERWNSIAAAIHGKRTTIVIDQLREFIFTGRCAVGNLGRTQGTARSFTVTCVCDPELVGSGSNPGTGGGTGGTDTPVLPGIAISYSGTTATVNGLNNTNINYSGTTATIGG